MLLHECVCNPNWCILCLQFAESWNAQLTPGDPSPYTARQHNTGICRARWLWTVPPSPAPCCAPSVLARTSTRTIPTTPLGARRRSRSPVYQSNASNASQVRPRAARAHSVLALIPGCICPLPPVLRYTWHAPIFEILVVHPNCRRVHHSSSVHQHRAVAGYSTGPDVPDQNLAVTPLSSRE